MTARPKLLVNSRAGAVVESRQERASSAALKSHKALKTEKDKPPPPLPGPEFWFRAPYLSGCDKLWRLIEVDAEIGKVVDEPLLGYKEVSVEEGCFISPKSVLRFQVERGEFPHCFSAYRNYVVPPTAFATWADDILGNADFVELLRKADVHRAVVNSLRLVVLRERKWMDVVVSRWSADSHTLPVAWGETGPTLEDVGGLLRLPMLGKDLGASKAGEEAHVVTDGPGLKKPAHLAAFFAHWLTWYIFPGPPKDGVDTTLFELAAILASGESVPLAPLFLGTLFKRLGMLQDAAQRSCGSYDFGASNSGGRGEPCRNVCQSARWSGSGIRGVRGSIADVLDVEGEFVARPYVNTPKGVFPFNVYSEEDVVTFANKDEASTAELFRMSCMMLGELPYFVNGRYGSVMYDPMRVARQFRFDQGVPKPCLPSGDAGDVWKRFLKSAFPAELRDNLVRFQDYVKEVPMSLGVEDVMSQDGELCLLKVKDPVLASFGARSPYVKEEVLGRVKEHLETIYGTGEKDGGSSASLSDWAGEGRAEEVRLSGKHTSKRPAKDVAEVTQPSKRKKTTKGNKASAEAVQPGVVEEVIRTPQVEIPETETGGGSEVPSTSVEVISTLDQHAAAHGGMDDIWGDEGVSSGRVPQPDVVEEVRKTPRVEVSEMAAGGGLDVPLDSLEAIGTFNQMWRRTGL
ncbi:hypothetical protein RHSIM_Rhsim10G0123400 [Rhododendron simsii]|uniref:Aminotransferase-like plant mobile domain-containing protein n=1 Tax=Rhododendron simsii TaxID=118357 RepID=A0A834L9P8_RHOSS|nr:hypothetical protein RHSIM_Rhsim10G0123400 [Rhododendron simsii]